MVSGGGGGAVKASKGAEKRPGGALTAWNFITAAFFLICGFQMSYYSQFKIAIVSIRGQ